MSHNDFDFEPAPGLPALLPAGEQLLWQGAPEWKSLAVRAYHVRKVAAYFLILVLWRVGWGLVEGHAPSAIAVSCLFLIGLGGVAIGVLASLAYFSARSTVYSITSRRVLLRFGVAVPLTMNVPFKLVDNAALKSFADGTGDISLTLPRADRIGYLITWPHLRPGQFSRPQPSFRALRTAPEVAQILGAALAANSGGDMLRLDAKSAQPAANSYRPLATGPRSAVA